MRVEGIEPVPATAVPPPGARAPGATTIDQRQDWIDAVKRKILAGNEEFQAFGHSSSEVDAATAEKRTVSSKLSGGKAPCPPLVDYVFAVENDPHRPDQVFPRLRWGGQFIYISRNRRKVAALPQRFRKRGFEVLHGPGYVRKGPFSLWIPFFSTRVYYFVARKVLLIPPGDISERFTYHVRLEENLPAGIDKPPGMGWVVRKEVPSLERVMARLRCRFPQIPDSELEKRARKFTQKIFPIFLTREAAILKILEQHLPEPYIFQVPKVLHMETDPAGYVQRLWMTWLRNGGGKLSQVEFAKQSADLLRALHEDARVIHLDLRPDNMVITPRGVGFVDFGSSVRVGENIGASSLLSTLFEELMRTSQIQRMLEQMTASGAVTSSAIANGYQKADQAVDFFYLALQINSPQANPDLAGLIDFDPESEEARALATLTQEILKPRNPHHPPYRSAKDIYWGIRHVENSLLRRRQRAGM